MPESGTAAAGPEFMYAIQTLLFGEEFFVCRNTETTGVPQSACNQHIVEL
jgi:hypothetical protein